MDNPLSTANSKTTTPTSNKQHQHQSTRRKKQPQHEQLQLAAAAAAASKNRENSSIDKTHKVQKTRESKRQEGQVSSFQYANTSAAAAYCCRLLLPLSPPATCSDRCTTHIQQGYPQRTCPTTTTGDRRVPSLRNRRSRAIKKTVRA